MSKTITEQDLNALAKDIFKLLERYGIEAELFSLGIRVPQAYYHAIKENFPAPTYRHPLNDTGLSVGDEEWAILIQYLDR
ncbi:MAG: hypothetical protein JXB47_11230 [Anaerolineae bacterium]|nr:hypothetical protein [Anaerolineae bacterium]